MSDASTSFAAFTRRRFLGATAAGAAALAGWSILEWPAAPRAQAGRSRTGSPWMVPFNTGWLFGPAAARATAPRFDDSGLATVTLPHTVTPLSWRDWDPDTWERTHVRHEGLRFTWPDVAPGQPDNVLALGQTIRMSGMGARLGFLGGSSPSRTMGTGTVHYADGSARDFTFTLDGYADEPGGENQTVAAPRDRSARVRDRSARVLFAAVRIVPGREVRAVTLPPNGVVPGGGPAQGMHIYAMTVG